MRLKPSELKLLGPRALAQLHAEGIDPGGDVPETAVPKRARKAPVRPAVDLSGLSSYDGTAFVIVLPLPNRRLSPNAHSPGAWRAHAAAKKAYRHVAATVAREALGGRPAPAWTHPIEQATFYWRTKCRHDADNALSSLKAAFDGITDAGIWIDDAGLTHEPVVMAHDKDRPRVEIRCYEKR